MVPASFIIHNCSQSIRQVSNWWDYRSWARYGPRAPPSPQLYQTRFLSIVATGPHPQNAKFSPIQCRNFCWSCNAISWNLVKCCTSVRRIAFVAPYGSITTYYISTERHFLLIEVVSFIFRCDAATYFKILTKQLHPTFLCAIPNKLVKMFWEKNCVTSLRSSPSTSTLSSAIL